MGKVIERRESFSFNDLDWPDQEIDKVKQEAERFCAEHNGEIECVEGHTTYINGKLCYTEPECWPRYVVSWEEEVQVEEPKNQGVKAAKIDEYSVNKTHCAYVIEQARELRALLAYKDDRMIVLNKTRALSAIDCAMSSLRELQAFIENVKE